MTIKSYSLPLIVILCGVLFSLYLQGQIPDGVFFSGDAGLKALLAQQLSSGQFRVDLVPPPQSWVRSLWENGLYPFEEPFVYHLENRHYITFPYTFPLITAPFHALFGYRGLYIIPLVSTWAIWLNFFFACRRLKFSPISTSLALFILIFASPLSMYSAMYWEHTLAVALSFYGLSLLLIPKQSEGLSKREAVFSGVSIGLSVWLRPEFLCLSAIVFVIVAGIALANTPQFNWADKPLHLNQLTFLANHKFIFLASLIVTVVLFFVSNQVIYSHPLGIHAIQIVEDLSLIDKLKDAWENFKGLGYAFFEYFQVAFFPVLYLGLALVMRTVKLTPRLILIYLICLVFVVGVSVIVPVGTAGLIAGGKQWGARFLLILIPIVVLMSVNELQLIWQTQRSSLKYGTLGVLSMLLILVTYKNTYAGTVYLQQNHQGILPAIQFLQKQPVNTIAMSHQFVAQALEPGLSQNKVFFLAENSQDLVKLGTALIEQGQPKFIYVCYPYRKCQPPEEGVETRKFNRGNQQFQIELLKLGEYGKYPIYEASINKGA
ncbi:MULTISPECIES: LA_3751/LA_3752 family putative glycosyltransferase [unclassified Coleofasciculus]|uniref:LA_3751/LA_3752 family putative glycosyltransferase n=1 Tax=unclassified Coleofasciculus TaxID=2692782 RepID=UPI001881034F|nr:MULTISPECIES: dolichol-phosphate mannosyltransferase [unclassified Coleofasciculus]MBE9124683.1 dolichol-phosphate mannosyltransferase [Coleofasciculus sp. LEGE 07081]MBE9147010.1 dolichol-phosphate mannosyltransferase [Coleofasciculus sp. LEGE 07092]